MPEIQPARCQTPPQQTVLLAASLGCSEVKYVFHLTLTQRYKYLSDLERVGGTGGGTPALAGEMRTI